MNAAPNRISRRCTVVVWGLVAVLIGCSAEAPDDRSGDPPAVSSPDDESLLTVLRTRLDGPDRDRDPRQVFEDLDGGQLSLRRFGEVPVSDGVPWHGGWSEGVTTSHLRVLHSLLIVNDLVAVGTAEALALAEEHVLDWRDANPPDAPAHPMAWHDETTARRALALVQLHDAKIERGVADEGDQGALVELITEHIELLASDEFHSTGTNHGMFQDRALLVATAYLCARGLSLSGVGDDYESLAARD